MWEGLEHLSWVRTLSETGWMYASVSVVHYFSIFISIGTAVILDLRILGLVAPRQRVKQLAEQLSPWMWTFLALALLSGFLEFSVDAGDYVRTWPFRVKLLVVLVALIFTAVIRWKIPAWDHRPALPLGAKVLAVRSVVLWIGAILSGTEIAALTGLG